MDNHIKTPWWFWAISGVMLLWNLMGVWAYSQDVQMSHEDMVEIHGQALADAASAQPIWVTVVYALAVFGGALGCLLLLLRKKIAVWPLIMSLVAVILQQGYHVYQYSRHRGFPRLVRATYDSQRHFEVMFKKRT